MSDQDRRIARLEAIIAELLWELGNDDPRVRAAVGRAGEAAYELMEERGYGDLRPIIPMRQRESLRLHITGSDDAK